MSPKQQLEALIHQCRLDLEAYAARADAKEGYLSKQNALLFQLVSIYNQLDTLHYHDIWVTVEADWEKVRRQDSNHAGIAVELITNPNGILCRLPIHLYEHGV